MNPRSLLVAFVLVTAVLVAWWLLGDEVARGSKPRPSLQAAPGREAPPPPQPIERGPGGEVPAPPAPPEHATIEGTVTGPNGPLWAVSVVAESTDEVAPWVSGGTNTEGRFRLQVEAPGNYRIVVAPDPATGVRRRIRVVRALEPGERRMIDVDLVRGLRAAGVIEGAREVLVSAVGAERYRDIGAVATTDWSVLEPHVTATVKTDEQGGFAFSSLEDLDYVLVVRKPGVELVAPVLFRAGDLDVRGVVAAVFDPPTVRDLGTGEAVAEFRATALDESGRVLEVFEGREGRLMAPLRFAPAPYRVDLVVESRGYFATRVWLRHAPALWLNPVLDASVAITVAYGDGAPARGPLAVAITARHGQNATEIVVEESGPGLYRTAIPPGEWLVAVRSRHELAAWSRQASTTVAAGEAPPLAIRLSRGGALVVRSPAAGVLLCDGPAAGRHWPLRAGENRFEDAAVGMYRLAAAHKRAASLWAEVKAGETTEVDLPPP